MWDEGVTSVEAVDPATIKVSFAEPKPYPYSAFVGAQSPIIQAAQFKDCLGPKAPECTAANFGPIGTGPFTVKEFKANDVITFEANPNYRDPAKPAFATVTLKGGGDAASAAASRRSSTRWPRQSSRAAPTGPGSPTPAATPTSRTCAARRAA